MAESAGTTNRSDAAPHCLPGSLDARTTARLLSASSDLALVMDPEGLICDVSVGESMPAPAAWGQLVGKRWRDTIARDSQSKVEQLLAEVRSGAVPRSREINQRAEGAPEGPIQVPFRFSAVQLDAERLVALGRDLRAVSHLQQQMISAQQAMDREYGRVRQAQMRYHLLFQVSAEGVVVADAASLKVVESNPAAAALLEDTGPGLAGRTLDELFQDRSWPQVQALLAAVEAGGRTADVHVALRGRGREVVASVSLFRQSGASLLLLRLRPTGAPVQAGASRESRVLAVVEALPDGFVVIDEDLHILSANPAFCELVQQANENQVVGKPLDRWLGRPGVDLDIMLANLREHGSVRNFATIVRGEYGTPQEAVVSAVSALDAKVPCLGFTIRPVSARLSSVPPPGQALPRSVDQLRELVGRVSLKEIVRESTDLIERLCIEAALKVSGDNRASAAQLLGLSRQGLYSKLRRHGLGDLYPSEIG